MSKPPSPVMVRLLSKTDRSGDCWIWTGATNGVGYGRMSMPPKSYAYAHRVWFEQLRGPIPAGLQLDHLCRNRLCCNPDHLEPVTNAENTRRGKISALRPKPTHCKHQHEYARDGYIDIRGKQRCRKCQAARQRAYRERIANAR